jgi:hypothetical protein
VCTSNNPTDPEINDHVSLQWPSYEQLQGSNLRPQREQTSWPKLLPLGHHLDGYDSLIFSYMIRGGLNVFFYKTLYIYIYIDFLNVFL